MPRASVTSAAAIPAAVAIAREPAAAAIVARRGLPRARGAADHGNDDNQRNGHDGQESGGILH